MKKTRNIIGIAAVVLLAAGIIIVSFKTPSSDTTASAGTGTSAPATAGKMPPPSDTTLYTLADVAQHPNAQSCWTAINGKVYNLTSWVGMHPGGEGAILSICGKDGTSAFTGQHGDDGRAQGVLATFMIGTLTN